MLNKFFSKKHKKPNEAYRILFEMFYDRVYKNAYFVTKDPFLAQDAVQETFLKAFRRIDDVEDGEKMGAWLSTIATRTAIDMMKKHKRWNGIPVEDVILEMANTMKEKVNSVEEEFETNWLKNRIADEIVTLKPEYREVLLLKFYHGMTNGEIAESLGLNIGNTKSRIFRARKKLKSILQPELHIVDGDTFER